ncbi:hypothetical protein HMPREF9078_00031 [Capnocytophaga sp. oral taxon 380 str. F0488]|nr:hypothetical protein HMPREF9078_00031 [Capnocytophaga sp. oral taxon 380 str. F0488]
MSLLLRPILCQSFHLPVVLRPFTKFIFSLPYLRLTFILHL